jgi:hypothetical protein
VAKYTEGIFPLCRKGQNRVLKNLIWGWSDSAAHVGKQGTTLPWRNWEQAETDSFKKKAYF